MLFHHWIKSDVNILRSSSNHVANRTYLLWPGWHFPVTFLPIIRTTREHETRHAHIIHSSNGKWPQNVAQRQKDTMVQTPERSVFLRTKSRFFAFGIELKRNLCSVQQVYRESRWPWPVSLFSWQKWICSRCVHIIAMHCVRIASIPMQNAVTTRWIHANEFRPYECENERKHTTEQ